MKKLWIPGMLALAALLLAPVTPAAAEEGDEPKTKEEASEARPERRHIQTYRERINKVTRKPLRKEIPDGPRTPEEREWRGIRDARPLVARKRTWPKRPDLTRWDHVKQISRVVTRPPREEK